MTSRPTVPVEVYAHLDLEDELQEVLVRLLGIATRLATRNREMLLTMAETTSYSTTEGNR